MRDLENDRYGCEEPGQDGRSARQFARDMAQGEEAPVPRRQFTIPDLRDRPDVAPGAAPDVPAVADTDGA